MKSEWKTTVREGFVAGLVLAVALSPVLFSKTLQHSPLILIGFASLFPVTGFVVGRKATTHPVWASIVSALVASFGILFLGIMASDTASNGASTVEGFKRFFSLLMVAKLMIEMWIQQTVLLTGFSAAGGALALLINRRKEKSSNQAV